MTTRCCRRDSQRRRCDGRENSQANVRQTLLDHRAKSLTGDRISSVISARAHRLSLPIFPHAEHPLFPLFPSLILQTHTHFKHGCLITV